MDGSDTRSVEAKFRDVYVGLSGLDLGGKRFEFPRGIVLEGTYAHLIAPITMAFKRPAKVGDPHPGPWRRTGGGFGSDITAQIFIPEGSAGELGARHQIGSTLVFLLRLWTDPGIVAPVISNMPFAAIADASEGSAQLVFMEIAGRSFQLVMMDEMAASDRIGWVVENFEAAHSLMESSPEFRMAANALSSGQFVPNNALILVSLWAALEAIFSPSSAELRFRISALIASFLFPSGPERLAEQKRTMKLYDKRSAAAHGKPSHVLEDLVATFELLRKVLLQCIANRHVPTKDELDECLFNPHEKPS